MKIKIYPIKTIDSRSHEDFWLCIQSRFENANKLSNGVHENINQTLTRSFSAVQTVYTFLQGFFFASKFDEFPLTRSLRLISIDKFSHFSANRVK